jgi:hypothetical protein
VHERVIANQEKSSQNPQEKSCPIVLSKEHGRDAAQVAVQVATELAPEKLVLPNETTGDKSMLHREGTSIAEAKED